jgi:antimicrobial peptide system SdpB family protein
MKNVSPWGPAYGLARSALALGTLLTLIGNPIDLLFFPVGHMFELPPTSSHVERWTLFWLLRDHLELARGIAVGILVVAAAGYRPRVFGVLQWWVALSFMSASSIPDGGDQVTTVLTLLLVPVTLTDPRKWHWSSAPEVGPTLSDALLARVARWSVLILRVQVCAIYLNAVMAKVRVSEWLNGTALYFWMTDPLMGPGREHLGFFSSLLSDAGLVTASTWSVLLMQVLLAMGLCMPRVYRPLLLPVGLLFHVGTVVAFGLMSFCLAMTGALLLYLFMPEAEVSAALRDTAQRLRSMVRARYTKGEPTRDVAASDTHAAPSGARIA